MEPLSAQISDVEENIEAIVRRNNVVDEEMQGMKNDIQSLSDKILVIKVSFIRYLISKRFNDNVISIIRKTSMERRLLAQRANNILSLVLDEMGRTQFDRIYLGTRLRLFFKFTLVETVLNLRESHSFEVECLFGSDGGQTVVNPIDWPEEGFTYPENESDRCSEANCHEKEIAYAPSKIQIKSLMALSCNCTQTVSHRCNINALTGYSSWIGSNGTANSYWHGARNSGRFQFFIIRNGSYLAL